MRKIVFYTIFGLTALSSPMLAASPTVAYIYNHASYIPAGLPGFGIAQGSLFDLYGANMGPTAAALAFTYPLATTPPGLGGTSITVTVNGITLACPMVAASSGQVSAIMPSTTPIGTGTLTLTYNGAASNAFPITVVTSAVGILTLNQQGSGEGVVTFANTATVPSAGNSAQSGSILTIWGTGLGASAGSDAEPPAQVDLGTPITAFVGGVQASILYRGRGPFPSIDQINFMVPAGPSGCNVSLIIETTEPSGTVVSNSTTLPIAPGGGACSDSNAEFPQVTLPVFGAKTSVNIGYVQVKQSNSGIFNNGQLFVSSSAQAGGGFINVTQAELPTLASALFTPSLGSCIVTITFGANAGQGGNLSGTALDAGASLSLTPPSGAAVSLTAGGANSQYGASLTSVATGTWQVSGQGGANVGPFTTSFTVPAQVTWTNETTIGALQGTNPVGPTIVRSQPLTINWSGGDANGYVLITVDGGLSNIALPVDVSASCAAPSSAGSFTVPTNVLLAFPNTAQQNAYGSVTVGTQSNYQGLNIPGLDGSIALSGTSANIGVVFQ